MDTQRAKRPLFLLLSLAVLGFAAGPLDAQEGFGATHVGVGLFIPQTDLPVGATARGQAQGRFVRGLTAWTDLSSRPAWLGLRLYGQVSVTFT